MAWVTLALRRQELIRTHNYLEMEDLKISRQLRQMQRQYSLAEMQVNDEAQKQLRDERAIYQQAKKDAKTNNVDSVSYQNALTDAKENYEYKADTIQTEAENETAMLEEEANMIEAQLQEQQVKIETEMEAVAQEMEAVKQQISTDIQNSTVSLH